MKTQIKCSIRWHFIEVCTVSYDKKIFWDRNTSFYKNFDDNPLKSKMDNCRLYGIIIRMNRVKSVIESDSATHHTPPAFCIQNQGLLNKTCVHLKVLCQFISHPHTNCIVARLNEFVNDNEATQNWIMMS